MNADQIRKRLERYGANMQGIGDRFMGDMELYEQCFMELLQEPNFSALDRAVKARDYPAAFSAAHALKGLTGNLGLTPMYTALSTLTEALRAKDYRNVDAQYAAVRTGYGRIRNMLSENARELDLALEAMGVEPPAGEDGTEEEKPKHRREKPDKLIFRTGIALLLVMLAVVGAFYHMIRSYSKSIAEESADHLAELNRQIQLYVENSIESDWRATYSLANSIQNSNLGDDESILAFAKRERDVWQLSDVMLYNAEGYGICTDGDVETNDTATKTIDRARKRGEYMTVQESQVTYTIPAETGLTYQGAPIVAVSAMQDMGTFLDNIGFSSFGGAAYLYLTREDGTVISKLNNGNTASTGNVITLLQGRQARSVSGGAMSSETVPPKDRPEVFLTEGPRGTEYVVTTPVVTRQENLRLFYFVPESTVNKTTQGFTDSVVILAMFAVVLFAVGALVVFLAVYRTRKRLFDRAILARERMFDLLIQNTRTAFGLIAVNQPEPVYLSSNMESVLGEPYLLLEKTDEGFQVKNTDGRETEAIRRINETMRTWDGREEFSSGYLKRNGVEPPQYFEIRLFPAAPGSPEYVGIAQDVTNIFTREIAAKNALNMAEAANAAKTRFLSNMSHDIRTPMNAIVNMTEFAIESVNRPTELAGYLRIIQESSEHLLHLVNDVLDVSRIESGRAVLINEPFCLRDELTRLADIVRPLCAARKQTFITDFSEVHTETVLGDPVKVSQILMNLLSNAVKFTPERGAVRFIAKDLPSLREGLASLRFIVEDNGIGIAKEQIQSMFEPFSRADDKRVSNIEGTGLGLSICHSYVTAMGGTVRCESEEGNGSVFTVELFFEKAEAAAKSPAAPAEPNETPFLGMRCLVCEDNDTNLLIAQTMLKRLGFLVESAQNGKVGVNKFLNSPIGYYDVIYMDIQMPVLDGYQAAVSIRGSGRADAVTVPIVAMTANVFAEDVEKARIAGMSGHLGKPLMTMDLIEETRWATRRGRG